MNFPTIKIMLVIEQRTYKQIGFSFFFDKIYWFVLILIFIISLNYTNFITKQTDKNG